MARTVVIGGGITGLSGAIFSKMKDRKSKVIVLESSERLGGWVQSKRFHDGSVHELGARTIRLQSPNINPILSIIDKLNISDKIISISKNNKNFQKRYIYAHDKLHLLDFSLLKPAQTPFTESILRKVVRASLKKYAHENHFQDLPVDYFFRTRFGDEIADYIVNPVIRGIYACDSRDLSMQATFNGMLEYEKSGPNVVIGALRNYLQSIFQGNVVTNKCISAELQKQIEGASVISFKGGLRTLIDNIIETAINLDVEVNTGSLVTNVKRAKSGELLVQVQDRVIYCDRILCATPSYVARTVLGGLCTDIGILDNIRWTSVAVVVLEFKGQNLLLSGFGHLIPSWEIPDVLGVIYDSSVLPENDNTAGTNSRYTVMLGGSWFMPNIGAMNTDELIDKAKEVLRVQCKIKGELVRSTVVVNHNCIPVYGLKHTELVATVRQSLGNINANVSLCGNSYDGVSLSDCVNSAHSAVESFYR